MDFDNKALDKYLVEVKRVEESRGKGADKEIRSLYKSLLKKLNSFIGEYYTKYSDDNGVLNVAILQQNAKYASFLEEVDKNIKEVTPAISKTIKSTVEKTYKACFEGMINGFSNSAGDSKFKDSFNGLSIKPEVLKAAVENPISGLTLPERLQKHRQDVIYDIRQSISNSLMTGERFDTTSKKLVERLDVSYGKASRIVRTESHRVQEKGLMDGAEHINDKVKGERFDTTSKKLVERLDVSYGKASRIVRTESHRVQEKGLMDGAEHINDKVKGDGLVYAAIWHNLGDEKVRPNVRVKTKKGWKTYKSHTNANHKKMEGQLIESGGYFDLGNGIKAKSPGESGDASNDCNCRCFVEYEMMTVEEFEERGGKWKNRNREFVNNDKFTSANNDDIIKSIDVDDFELFASSKSNNILPEVSKVITDTIKEFENQGGMYISEAHFGEFYDAETGKPALFQVFPNAYGLTELNVNSKILGGKTLDEINELIKNTPVNIANSLEEAVVHECGHAKAYYQKAASEIEEMNKTIKNKGVKEISKIAGKDGAECIAEVEVLLYRGEEVPEKAMELYNEWTRGKSK